MNSVGHILVATASFTGSSAVNVNSVFTSAYVNYYATFNFSAFSANSDLYLRLRASGTDVTTGYQYVLDGSRVNGTTAVLASSSATYIEAIRCRQGIAAPTRHAFQATFVDPQIAGETKVTITNQCDDGVALASYVGSGFLLNSNQYDGFTLYPSTGTFAGTYRVYGLRPSF
jgi:hypothetical protein